MQRSRDNLRKVVPLVMICLIASLESARSQNYAVSAADAPSVDGVELVVNWKVHFDTAVSVLDDVSCGVHDCTLYPDYVRAAIKINIDELPAQQKADLVRFCQDSCRITVRGRVTDESLVALAVVDTYANIERYRRLRGFSARPPLSSQR
jgi:hypothetical protein